MDTSDAPDRSISLIVGKRLRVKQACEPCKTRKKKCNGQNPCSFCIRYEHNCHYETVQSERLNNGVVNASQILDVLAPTTTDEAHSKEPMEDPSAQSIKINSGAVFARSLITRLNTASSCGSLAWNLGVGTDAIPTQPRVYNIISRDEMFRLARVYFAAVHEFYGFLDEKDFYHKVATRWERPDQNSQGDSVLCGVAVLGSLFSGSQPHMDEGRLVELAKNDLGISSFPNRNHVAGSILRTLCLRCTSQPYAAWMSSCTTMHMIEVIENCGTMDTSTQEDDSRNRMFLVAQIFNAWISNEFEHPKVKVEGLSPRTPTTFSGNDMSGVFYLWDKSRLLDAESNSRSSDFEQGITDLVDFKSSKDSIILSQCNLAFALYRRLWCINTHVSPDVSSKVMNLGISSLDAAQRLAMSRQPWWHVANAPFQYLCELLVMDTTQALTNFQKTLTALELVKQHFPTTVMEEALRVARTLVWLARKRKNEDVGILNKVLEDHPSPLSSNDLDHPTNWQDTGLDQLGNNVNLGQFAMSNYDWDALLMADCFPFPTQVYSYQGAIRYSDQ